MGLLRSPDGSIVSVPDEEEGSARASGYSSVSLGEAGATTGEITPEDRGVSGVIGAGASSTLSGVTLGLSDVALKGILTPAQYGRIASDRAQHSTLSAGGQFVGALAPSLLTGGATTPAGLTSSLGHAIVQHAAGEGAGLAARVGAATLGAGVEGALYGGGDYLSQVALEDKPLSAEGFVAGMGHGALFAAPVGGALTLGGAALLRARSLFPRSEITAAAAKGIQQDATSTLAQSVSDGDAMAAAAQRKVQLIDAKVGQAQAGENVTRRMFGQADPMALGDQAAGGAEKAQITEALQKYQASKAQLSDWIANEADPDLEASMRDLQEVDLGEGRRVPVGEFGAPGEGGMKSSAELAQAAADAGVGETPSVATPSSAESTRAGKRPAVFPDGTPALSTPRNVEDLKVGDHVAGHQITEIAPDPERVFPWNETYDKGKIDTLADSMRNDGWKGRPLVVTEAPGGKIRALTGSHRLEAAAEAGINVPALKIALPEGLRSTPFGIEHSGELITDARELADLLEKKGVNRDVVTLLRSEEGGAVHIGGEPAGGDLEALLRGTQDKLAAGESLPSIGAPSRAEYMANKAAKTREAADHFRAKANAKNFAGSDMAAAERSAKSESMAQRAGVGGRGQKYARAGADRAGEAAQHLQTQVSEMAMEATPVGEMNIGSAARAEPTPRGQAPDWSLFGLEGGAVPSAAEHLNLKGVLEEHGIGKGAAATEIDHGMRARIAEHQNIGRTIVDSQMRGRMGGVAEEAGIARALAKAKGGKSADLGPSLARAAKVIGDHEEALAGLVDAVGSEAPASAVTNANAFRAARAGQADASAASTAKAVTDIQSKVPPAAISSGALGKAADAGTALEVLRAMGVHVPGLGAIPVIGPILSLFLKARAVMGILGRKGGSIGKTTEGLVASKAAAVRDRINAATNALLTVTGRVATKAASFAAGPSVTLATKLFPGGKAPRSDDPVDLYHARLDEITRAQQPGAIDHAISDRYQTADPQLHDAIVAQTAKGISFLDSKVPKQTTMPGMLPGDGTWSPSKAALETFGRYVHAVNDPASVLEDLAKGHVTLEGAETLRVVYPALFAEAQRTLLEAAPKMQTTLPYPRRVMISIMYQVPLDGTMTPSHMQYLKTAKGGGGGGQGGPQSPAAPPSAPAIAGPLRTAPQTMTALDRRAGA